MIPSKKKSAEEISALRDHLAMSHSSIEKASAIPDTIEVKSFTNQEISTSKIRVNNILNTADKSDIGNKPKTQKELKPLRSLRKQEIPLEKKATTQGSQKAILPTQRQDQRDLQQVIKREKLGRLAESVIDPVTRLRQMTASPFLLVVSYTFATASAITAILNLEYFIPLLLVILASAMTILIGVTKIRSRHHAYLLFIIVFFVIVFGTLHYAPQIKYGS